MGTKSFMLLDKNGIRRQILEKLKNQDKAERDRKSLLAKDKLFSLPEFKKAEVVMFYLSMDGEVETFGMIEAAFDMGKRIAVPIIDLSQKKLFPSEIFKNERFVAGPCGILQPACLRTIPHSDLDIVIVPGVAFSPRGDRLGRGKGYYDRFLKEIPAQTLTIGLAFDFQIFKDFPPLAPHDVPLDKVIAA
jgi:5-formyltetrahydrofolate cyclo-ligase